jgi:hypothetical protein
MTPCDFCGTKILFGGVHRGDLRFCKAECADKSDWVRDAMTLPNGVVDRQVGDVHQGNCPKCGGRGPVDVYTSHKVYSVITHTVFSSHPELCCRSCGRKKQLKHGAFSFFLGWWGFPSGLLITPVQLARNFAGLVGIGGPDPEIPSAALCRMVRLDIAAKQRAQARAKESERA